MRSRIDIHPTHPQGRLIDLAVRQLAEGSLLLIPTDAGYAFAWSLDALRAEERVIRLRALDRRHPFTLICAGLSDVGHLAQLDNRAFRFIKPRIPGPATFLLPASAHLPRRLKQAKRRVIGCRVPDHPVVTALLDAHGEPLLVTSVELPGEELENSDPDALHSRLEHVFDLMLDAGPCPAGPTSVIDLCGETPELIRAGAQEPDWQDD